VVYLYTFSQKRVVLAAQAAELAAVTTAVIFNGNIGETHGRFKYKNW